MPSARKAESSGPDESSGLEHDNAIRSPAAVAVFLTVAAVGLAADLLSKHFVFKSMLSDTALSARVERIGAELGRSPTTEEVLHAPPRVSRRICPGVRFTLSTNKGVVFGLAMNRALVAVATGVTILLVGFFFATSPGRARSVHLALALILAGALGNLYDRLFSEVALPGREPICRQVRDFIDLSELGYVWIFNVADVWLVVGVVLLVVHWLLVRRETAAGEESARGRK